MINDLVSVLIPAYNHERYIEECIRSIIAQTYRNIELLVIDDGSKDRTFEILQSLKLECEQRFVSFVCMRQENSGCATTLNLLLQPAKGKYVYMMASDDVAKPQAIEKLYAAISSKPQCVFAVGDDELIDANSQKISWDDKKNIVPFGQGYNSFGEYLKSKRPDVDFYGDSFGSYKTLLGGNYVPNGVLLLKSAVDKYVHYTSDAPLEDWYMNLQMAKAGKYVYVDEILFSYRWHQSNTIKHVDEISKYSQKTFDYEQQIVQQPEFAEYKKIFDKFAAEGRKKVCFKLGDFLEIYRSKSPFYSRKYLRLFGKVWCLSDKKR